MAVTVVGFVLLALNDGLPSLAFLALLLLTALALALGTAWAWTRWSPRSAWLGRAVGLLLIACMGGLISLDLLNRSGQFYSSFGDLFGTTSAGGPAPVLSGSASGANVTVLTQDWQRIGEQLAATDQGEVVRVLISGPRSGLRRRALIYLPPEYFLQPAVRFPALELIHGFAGRPQDWIDATGLNVVAILDQERRAGRMAPVVAVMPTASVGPSTECVDAVGGERDETYLAFEVPEAVSGLVRLLNGRSWAVGGVSTGGFCAANLALHHPDRYAAAISLSGYFTAGQDPHSSRLYKNQTTARDLNSPAWVVDHRRPSGPPLFVMASRGDRDAVEAVRVLLAAVSLGDPTFPVTATELSGGHNWGTWRKSLPAALDWASAFLPRPTAPPLLLPPFPHSWGGTARPPSRRQPQRLAIGPPRPQHQSVPQAKRGRRVTRSSGTRPPPPAPPPSKQVRLSARR